MSTTGHETEAINVQGLKASLQKLKTENLDPNVNKGVVNEATCSTAAGTAAKTVTAPASFSLTSGAAILVKFTNGISVDNATLAVGSTAAKPIYYKGAALEADYVEAGDIIMLKYDGTNYNVVGKLGGRALPEVQIGGTTPTSESEIKLFVDEESDDTVEVYTKAQANILYAGKTDKVSGATNGNFAGLDANGNIKDSGKNENSFQLKVTDCAMLGCAYVTCVTASATAAKVASLTEFELRKNCIVSVLFTYGFTTSNSTLNVNNTGAKPIFYHGAAVEPLEILSNTVAILQYDGTNWNIVSKEVIVRNYGDEWVDLGLPSGTLWCKHNVGATNPEENGDFFTWGNTTPYQQGDVYDNTPGAAYKNSSIPLSADAARVNMGAPWRLPNFEECNEMINGTTKEWVTVNGVSCVKATSKYNGNYILFIADGWSTYFQTSYYDPNGNYHWWSIVSSDSNSNKLILSNAQDYSYPRLVRPVM